MAPPQHGSATAAIQPGAIATAQRLAPQGDPFMLRLALAAALLAAPALAQDKQAETGHPPDRIRDVTVQKGQRCPQSTADEVVVCHVLDEPYRIPKALRDDGPIAAAGQSWVNRAATVDQVSRVAGGVPDSCSAVGLAGQSGCYGQQLQQWSAERHAQIDGSANVQSTAAAAAHPNGTAQ
jgi:hypothetical protein